MTEHYYLDVVEDIKTADADGRLPYGYMELLPGSGVGIPDLSINQLKPGYWPPRSTEMPKHPLDLAQITVLKPGALGPYGSKELAPNSGVWIPDPQFNWLTAAPPARAPRQPLDLATIKKDTPGGRPPAGYRELIPGSGIFVPAFGQDTSRAGETHLSSSSSEDPAGAPNKVFEVDFRQLEGYARTHDLSTEEIARWVQADPGLPERFLQTHGKVAYATYLKIKEYADSRQVQGTIYAHRNASTAEALRNAVRVIDGVDTDNANRLNANRPTVT